MKTRSCLLLLLLWQNSAVSADTDAPTANDDQWGFIIAPYAWLAGTGGTTTTDGVDQEFDLSFEDIFDLTTGGFQIYTQARYKRFFFSFDGFRVKHRRMGQTVDRDSLPARQLSPRVRSSV